MSKKDDEHAAKIAQTMHEAKQVFMAVLDAMVRRNPIVDGYGLVANTVALEMAASTYRRRMRDAGFSKEAIKQIQQDASKDAGRLYEESGAGKNWRAHIAKRSAMAEMMRDDSTFSAEAHTTADELARAAIARAMAVSTDDDSKKDN